MAAASCFVAFAKLQKIPQFHIFTLLVSRMLKSTALASFNVSEEHLSYAVCVCEKLVHSPNDTYSDKQKAHSICNLFLSLL